jgi:hypothetical protein
MSVIDGESVRVYNKTLNGLDTLGDTEVGDLTVTGDLLVEGSSSFEDGLDMNSTKITELANGTVATDAVNLSQLSSAVGDYLPLAGGTMDASANIDMNGGKVEGLAAATGNGEAVRYNEFNTLSTSVSTNTADIATNTADIATNTADIATNATAIAGKLSNPATGDLSMGSYKITTVKELEMVHTSGGALAYGSIQGAQDADFITGGSVYFNRTRSMLGVLSAGYKMPTTNPTVNQVIACSNAATGELSWTAGSSLSLWTAGAGTIIYYNSGLVGINKTTPVARLHVKGTGDYDAAEQVALFEDTRTGGATPRSTGITSTGITGRYDYNGQAGLAINYTGYAGGNTQYRDVYFYDGRNNLTGTFTGQTGNLNIDGLLTAGVGQVGSWSANTDFTVFCHSSNNTAGNYAMIQQSTGALYINRPTGQTINFRENNSTSQMVILSGGDVGIGTVSPDSKLHIHDNAEYTILTISNSDGFTGKEFEIQHYRDTSTYAGSWIWNRADTAIRFGTNNTERLVISNDERLFLSESVAVNNNKGIFWHNGGDWYAYGLYRSSGAWSFPYAPLVLSFATGVRIVSRDANYGYIGFSNDDGDQTHTSSLIAKIETYDSGTYSNQIGEFKSIFNPMLIAAGNIQANGTTNKARGCSVVYHSTGIYTVTLSPARADRNYVVNVNCYTSLGYIATWAPHGTVTNTFYIYTFAGSSGVRINMAFTFTVTDWY